METRRDRDDTARDQSQAADRVVATAVTRFGDVKTWPEELSAGVSAVGINPMPTLLWWGDGEPLHNGLGRAGDLAADPAVTDAVATYAGGRSEAADVAQLEVSTWLVSLRRLHDDAGRPAGALAVAVESGELRTRFEAELARSEERTANLQLALDSNRQIGTAIGILMSERRITQDAAFDLLRTASQRHHRKLRALADDVVLLGTIPESPSGG